MLPDEALDLGHLGLQLARLGALGVGDRLELLLELGPVGLELQDVGRRALLVVGRGQHLLVEAHDVFLQGLDVGLQGVDVVADLLDAPLGDLDLLAEELF